MLFMCGHTICNQCLIELKDTDRYYVCHEDNKVKSYKHINSI